MINKSIEEKNFMIAKFMGGQQNELNKQNNSIFLSHIDDSVVQYLDDLKYHDSISWQLPVLKRIENMGFIVELFLVLGGCCKIMKAGFKSPFVSFGNFSIWPRRIVSLFSPQLYPASASSQLPLNWSLKTRK